MPRSKHTAVYKLAILEAFRQSGEPIGPFSQVHGVDMHTLKCWQALYDRQEITGLTEVKKNRHYLQTLKLAVITAYLNGEGTLRELTIRFDLLSKSQLLDWLNKYNGNKTLTASPSRKQVLTISRKTTFEERIEIVEYVTKHKHSYAEVTEHFHVSYQQARSWVIRAQNDGYEAFVDRRGHRKPATELIELDKLRLENRQLESQLADKELVEAFAKKLL
ncbi:helix-turn-helix domain-containing protein [Lactiplantibacillus plantarum]|nr:helix-turn-helix domain-containing protein [Lactiplantibacillus plantarum]